jgi:hypothetical protein
MNCILIGPLPCSVLALIVTCIHFAPHQQKSELQQKLENADIRTRDLESKNAALIETVKQQAAELDSFSADTKRLGEVRRRSITSLWLLEMRCTHLSTWRLVKCRAY